MTSTKKRRIIPSLVKAAQEVGEARFNKMKGTSGYFPQSVDDEIRGVIGELHFYHYNQDWKPAGPWLVEVEDVGFVDFIRDGETLDTKTTKCAIGAPWCLVNYYQYERKGADAYDWVYFLRIDKPWRLADYIYEMGACPWSIVDSYEDATFNGAPENTRHYRIWANELQDLEKKPKQGSLFP